MRCFVCHRVLLRCAVPNLQIGPTCARKRGYLSTGQDRRTRTARPARGQKHQPPIHPLQLDWINTINTGPAGESAAP